MNFLGPRKILRLMEINISLILPYDFGKNRVFNEMMDGALDSFFKFYTRMPSLYLRFSSAFSLGKMVQ